MTLHAVPDIHEETPVSVLSVVPDLPDDTVSSPEADLAGIVAEIAASAERTAAHLAALAALIDEARRWFVKFSREAWEFAEGGDGGGGRLCETWERYTNEVGVLPRPRNSSNVTVRGYVRVPMTAGTIVEQLPVTAEQANLMLKALPADQRYARSALAHSLLLSDLLIASPDWDPLGSKRQCICPQARAKFAEWAVRNYRSRTVDPDITISGCPAGTHIEESA